MAMTTKGQSPLFRFRATANVFVEWVVKDVTSSSAVVNVLCMGSAERCQGGNGGGGMSEV